MTTKGQPCGPKSRKHRFLINFPSLTPIFNHLHFCREMHNVFNLLLASLCVADSMFLLCNIAIAPVAFGRMDLLTPGDGEIVTKLVMMFCSALHLPGMWGLCQLGLEHLHHCQPHIWEISGDFADFCTWLPFYGSFVNFPSAFCNSPGVHLETQFVSAIRTCRQW